MKSQDALQELEQIITKSGKNIQDLRPDDAISLMLSFYEDSRADDVDLESDGDMLLFQWGTYDWGQGEYFEYNITRQFIAERTFTNEESQEAWTENVFEQLSLTLKYAPDEAISALPSGSKWCYRPEELPSFAVYISESLATQIAREKKTHIVELNTIIAN